MPWKESGPMDERVSFIARLRDGESMSELCREYGISRKTGYKFLRRYDSEGPRGLADRSSRPHQLARLTDPNVTRLVLKAKECRPNWGAAKLRVLLYRDHPNVIFPSKNTVHAILERHGLVRKRRRRPVRSQSETVREESQAPNDLWCADYKGQFKLQNGQYCYPLTISDHFSRYLLSCDSHVSTRREDAFATFDEAFEQYGVPKAIRTDNGPPFACTKSIHRLSKLSAWWMSLGIRLERNAPGCPQHNGRHERIHLTMKIDDVVQKPAKCHMTQQDALELFRVDYNEKRPHQALGMAVPNEIYRPSKRKYEKGRLPEYPASSLVYRVSGCGAVTHRKSRFFLSEALSKHLVALQEEDDDMWSVTFMDLDLGYFDAHEGIFHRSDT